MGLVSEVLYLHPVFLLSCAQKLTATDGSLSSDTKNPGSGPATVGLMFILTEMLSYVLFKVRGGSMWFC